MLWPDISLSTVCGWRKEKEPENTHLTKCWKTFTRPVRNPKRLFTKADMTSSILMIIDTKTKSMSRFWIFKAFIRGRYAVQRPPSGGNNREKTQEAGKRTCIQNS